MSAVWANVYAHPRLSIFIICETCAHGSPVQHERSWFATDNQESLQLFGPNGGTIIDISSVASTGRAPAMVVYAASKAAVDSVTRVLAAELAPKKIRVNALSPNCQDRLAEVIRKMACSTQQNRESIARWVALKIFVKYSGMLL